MIEFKRIDKPRPAAEYLVELLQSKARNKKILFLVPGGSALPIARTVLAKLPSAVRMNIAITLTDERYGAIGHKDENWNQLVDGIELSSYAEALPVNTGAELDTTEQNYAKNLERLVEWADQVIGLFGMGADGHTAGILPQSAATAATSYACAYSAEPFVRITTTPLFFKHLDTAVLYAVGEDKQPMIDALSRDVSYVVMPAQLLKEARHFIVFNDYKGVYSS